MSNPWFRMYAEFAHDPKVQMLSETMQRRYVMLMCLRCSNALVTLHETEVAFALRITDEELVATKALFVAKGFIDPAWNLLNWEKRQFASDSSAARVAEHRRRKKEALEATRNGDVTLPKRQANALDTDTDTDTEKTSSAPAKKKKSRTQIPEGFIPNDAGMEAAKQAGLDVQAEIRRFTDWHEAQGSLMANWQAGWRTWIGKAIDFGRGKAQKPQHGDTSWLKETGFETVAEAQNNRCHIGNAHEFRNRQRIEVPA